MYIKSLLLLILTVLTMTGCNDDNSSPAAAGSSSTTNLTGFQVTGRISVASNTAKDNDINDPRSPALPSNNTISSAQRIPNPVMLGGYVNQPNAGAAGRSKTIGDIDDVFFTELRTGQVVFLSVASQDLSSNDLDLALLDAEGQVVDASVGAGATEVLTVPKDGTYFIVVHTYLGASNYVLSIGQETPANLSAMRLTADFAPNEVIVKFKPEVKQALSATLSALGLHTESQDTSRRMLFTLDPSQSRLLATEDLQFTTPELRSKYETLMAIKQLRHREEITEASPNYNLHLLRVPNDTLYRYQWNLPMMNLPLAWDTTTGSSTVTVAVIDTGVLLQHPDLAGKTVPGHDFIRNVRTSLDGDGIDSNPDDPGDQSPNGSTFHGSHVAGTIAANTNNNNGIAGVGWQTKVMPLRVLGKGGAGSDYDIEQAIRFAAGLANDSTTVPARHADIINLSLGGPEISSGFQDLMDEVRAAGVIVVAAAGNDGTNTTIYPASLNGVVSVSGVDINKKLASYSNYGPFIDVAAPGGDSTPDVNGDGVPDGIISTVGDDTSNGVGKTKIEYTFTSSIGTSMASPQVAGVIALMKAVYPALTPQQFDDLLSSGTITEDLGTPGRDDKYGYGLIDAHKAVLAAVQLSGGVAPKPQPKLVVNPSALNFSISTTNLTLTLGNGGGGDLQVTNISDNAGGFLTTYGQGLGDYIITVDRSRLAPDTYTATITIVTNTNTVKVPVILQVGDPNITGDAGLQYVLLIDPKTFESVQQTPVTAVSGVYEYKFDNVPKGTYLVATGSDINNDNYICDIGEACGAYLVVRNPTAIDVNGNVRLKDFSTSFNVSFAAKAATEVGVIPIPREVVPRFKLLPKAGTLE